MREDYKLLTPENVELQYDVAGMGSRLAAAPIDYTIISIGFVGILFGGFFVAAALPEGFRSSGNDRLAIAMAVALIALAVLLTFAGWWGYFLLFELAWGGQTPGKRGLGLRVVRGDGQPLDFTASLVRNLLRLIDVLLPIGACFMLFDASSRRLGDMAAGTLVVRDPRSLRAKALEAVAVPRVDEATVHGLPNAGRLTMEHYTVIRDYFDRASRLSRSSAESLALHLARQVAQVIEVDPATIGPPDRFLAAVMG